MQWYAIRKDHSLLTSEFVDYFARETGNFTILGGREYFVFMTTLEVLQENFKDFVFNEINIIEENIHVLNISRIGATVESSSVSETTTTRTIDICPEHSGQFDGKNALIAAVERSGFADFIKMDVRLYNPHNSSCNPKSLKDNTFKIIFYSWPTSSIGEIREKASGFIDDGREVFGRRVSSGQSDGPIYSIEKIEEKGFFYVLDEFNRVVGVYIPEHTALFIPFDLPHCSSNADYFLAEILTRLMDVIKNGNKKIPVEDMAKNFTQRILGRKVVEIKKEIDQYRSYKNDYLRKAIEYEKVFIQKEKELTFYEGDTNTIVEKFLTQLKEVETLPFIDSIKIARNGSLVVTTKDMVTTNLPEYGVRKLGKIEIHFSENNVKLKKPVGSEKTFRNYAHPHNEDNNGNVCWGNIGSAIMELLPRFEYLTLTNIIHDFIVTPNIHDTYGCRISEWPKA